MQILKQDCDLTLREGLAELYRANPEVESVSKAKGKMFTDHDLTHVIFGCDTSLIGEIVLKPWILFGTTINIEEMKTYAADPEVRRLNEEGRELMGGQVLGTLKLVFYYLPQFFWIWLTKVRKMRQKWPHSAVTEDMLESKICDLRKDYNIRILQSQSR